MYIFCISSQVTHSALMFFITQLWLLFLSFTGLMGCLLLIHVRTLTSPLCGNEGYYSGLLSVCHSLHLLPHLHTTPRPPPAYHPHHHYHHSPSTSLSHLHTHTKEKTSEKSVTFICKLTCLGEKSNLHSHKKKNQAVSTNIKT